MKEEQTFDKDFKRYLSWFVLAMIVICVSPLVLTMKSCIGDFTTTGQIGDTIGGIMGPFIAIGFGALTFLAFWVQYKANEQQKIFLRVERLETRLFEMIKWHRDNISELEYIRPIEIDPYDLDRKAEINNSRKVFEAIFQDIKDLNGNLDSLFIVSDLNKIYEPIYLEKLKNNMLLNKRAIDLRLYAQVDILFCILYFGLSTDGIASMDKYFEGRYNRDFYSDVIWIASTKPLPNSDNFGYWKSFSLESAELKLSILSSWKSIWNNSRKADDVFNENGDAFHFRHLFQDMNYKKFYEGHQFRLTHYFTHLFHTIKYIDQSTLLTSVEKSDNIALIRAQLSTYEQVVLFFYSISILGRDWELENTLNSKMPTTTQLISTYELIKNVHNNEILYNINISMFYPDINIY